MKRDEIRYIYYVDLILDIYEVLESLRDELNLEEGEIEYFSLEKDDLVRKRYKIEKLIEVAQEITLNDESPSIIFGDVEVIVYDNIQILAKNQLKLDGIDVVKVEKMT